MIILSQDRKTLVKEKIKNIQVVRNLGGSKDSKYILSVNNGIAANAILGQYPDEKTAADELEKIFAAISEGAKTYRVN